MQSVPLAVLKLRRTFFGQKMILALHAIRTACGIETALKPNLPDSRFFIACNPYRLRY